MTTDLSPICTASIYCDSVSPDHRTTDRSHDGFELFTRSGPQL